MVMNGTTGFEDTMQLSIFDLINYTSTSDENTVDTENIKKNFRITDFNIGVGNVKERFRGNVEAIKVLKRIEAENRYATENEQKILSNYVGWGGLSDAFNNEKAEWSEEFTT